MSNKKALTVAALSPAPYNPRTISDDQLKALGRAMEAFGDLSGIVFNRGTGNLVCGHQRTKHLPADLPVVITERFRKPNAQNTTALGFVEYGGERWAYREVDVDAATEKAMNVAANKHGGAFDFEKLGGIFDDLHAAGLDATLTGFVDEEIGRFGERGAESDGAGATLGDFQYQVVVSCAGEHQQAEICEELEKRGLKCRMLTL